MSSISTIGRVVMANHVLNTMANYVMGIFKLLKGLADWMNRMLANFIWAGDKDGRGIHWKARRILCTPKSAGGLGLHSIHNVNQALLAKVAWKIIDEKESLLSKFFLSKYCSKQNFREVRAKPTATWGWKGILWGRDLLKPHLKWQVISGRPRHSDP